MDIASMFDVLPLDLVRRAGRAALADPLWWRLLDTWLAAWPTVPRRGVPQGAPLSPMLSNLALAEVLDRPLELLQGQGTWGLLRWVRYGDDLTLICGRCGVAPAVIGWVQGRLSPLGMSCKASKTEVRSRNTALSLRVLGHELRPVWTPEGWRLQCP